MVYDRVSPVSKYQFFYRIGSCPKCIRQSFFAAVMALAVGLLYTMAVAAFGWPRLSYSFELALYVACIGFLALWALHLVAFAMRATFRMMRTSAANPQKGSGAEAFTRRKLGKVFLAAFGGILVNSAMPTLAMAFGQCPGEAECDFTSCSSNGGAVCCPRGYIALSACDCKCYKSIADLRASGCNTSASCYN